MVVLIGIGIVIGSIVAGYMMAGGHMLVLYQPSEFIIIGGAAVGAMLIGTTPRTLGDLFRQLPLILKSGPTKRDYTDLLVMLYEIMTLARRDGLLGLDTHIEAPQKSDIFKKYPRFLQNHHALNFMADTLRLVVAGAAIEAHDLEELMDVDIEAHHHESSQPAKALQVMGDSLPGLGIVAAVLGIVITMQSIDGPPEEIGHHVGAALVGTFLGVLLAYGFVGPVAKMVQTRQEALARYVQAIKMVLLNFQKGSHPAIAVEFARRSLLSDVRPGYAELEKACRGGKAAA